MKGIFKNEDGKIFLLQAVQELFEIEESTSKAKLDSDKSFESKIVIIGREMDVEMIEKSFLSCVVDV